ncbi:MAG: OmpA family protein [Mesorhizobium sp.]
MFKKLLAAALISATAYVPVPVLAQSAMPNAAQIERQLGAEPRQRLAPNRRVSRDELRRRPEIRRMAPSIDIQSINFATGSAEIDGSQYRKIESIATAMNRILRRNRSAVFLIEGHTDAIGSFASNQSLSERRANSLRRVLVQQFNVPRRALDTVGYGEEFLLVQTQNADWRNRRVTLRNITEVVRPY